MSAHRTLPVATAFAYTVKDVAANWLMSERYVRAQAEAGNITGADKTTGDWRFPASAALVKPVAPARDETEGLARMARAAQRRQAKRAAAERR